MTMKQILKRYNKKVPFPLTLKKIRAAGHDPEKYMNEIIYHLKRCTDYDGRVIAFQL